MLSSRDGILRVGVRRRLRSVLDQTLSALKSHCLMLAAAGATGDSRDRVKILEIRRADGKVELDLDDQRFIMAVLHGREGA